MSYYRNQSFTSPDPIIAKLKLELNSYFATGTMDETLIPTWIDDCLRKLGRGTYKVEPSILHIDDFMACLPDDFIAVREARSCYPSHSITVKEGGATYQQMVKLETEPADACSIVCNGPDQVNVFYKSNNFQTYTYQIGGLLTPGNISSRPDCNLECRNWGASTDKSFDIRGNKFITNFRCGDVYMLYYTEELDEDGNQMIPDNYEIKKYIESHIKYKLFEQMYNQVTDESYNQAKDKFIYYKSVCDETFVIANTEAKKEDAYDKQRALKRTLNRNNRYKINNGGAKRFY